MNNIFLELLIFGMGTTFLSLYCSIFSKDIGKSFC